jgi:folate-binding protein YgfZ
MNTEEYHKAHKSVAIYDASLRFGRVAANGKDAIDLLHRMSTNDLLPLIDKPGTGAQTVLTTEKGRIIDLVTVLSHGTSALLITSGEKEEAVIEWLDKYVIMEDANFAKKSDEISQFLIFGPKAMEFLESLISPRSHMGPISLMNLENFHFQEFEITGEKIILQKTHRIIESGWAIFTSKANSEALLALLQSKSEEFGGTVIGDDTYNLLRIEAGIPLAPSELNEKHNPLETTLVQAVSWTKGCYIGQEVIARLDTYDKVQRHLMGVEIGKTFHNGSLPIPITNTDGEQIGEITSLEFSPSLEKNIGLGFIKTAYAIPNMNAKVGEEDAKLVKLPFELP